MPLVTPGAPSAYTSNTMLDVAGGVIIYNAPAAPGVEVYASSQSSRFSVDWPNVPNPVTFTRIQVVGRSSTATAAVVKVRDITNGVDVVSVNLTSTTAGVFNGPWTAFTMPTAGVTYAVFVQGDGVIDPTLYSVTWEWR